MTNNMSDEEAQKEYDDIQAEIAKEKGQAPEKKPDPETKEDDKPAPEDSKDKTEKSATDDDSPADDEDIEPRTASRTDDKVPLKRYLDTKEKLETEKADLQTKVEDLTNQLNRAKTDSSVKEKVKTFAEKHGMAEDTVLDLVQLVRGEAELDPTTKKTIEQASVALKKQEALEKFSDELSAFIAETPEAADFEKEIRAKAFEKANLDKSLFEIFHRFVKTEEAPKRKTGETSRPGNRQAQTGFDVKKILAKVEAGTPKPFEGLTDAQVDEVFAVMEKTGSRYS